MMAGTLKERIKIFKPVKTKNSFGEEEVTWEAVYSTRAEIVHNGGNRATENNEIVLGHNKTFRVRAYVPVDDFCRIQYKGELYRIINIEHLDASQMIEIQTEKINE